MIPQNRISTHPGEILKYEFLEPSNITQKKLSDHIGVPIQRINQLINGKRGITPDTAWKLSMAFGNSPEFWMNAQALYDLTSNRPEKTINKIA